MKRVYKVCMQIADGILILAFLRAAYCLIRHGTPMSVTALELQPVLGWVITLCLVLHLCSIKDIRPPARDLRDRFLFGWEFAVETCGNVAILCVLSYMYVSFGQGMDNAQLQLAIDSVRLWAMLALIGIFLPERHCSQESEARESEQPVKEASE